MRYDTTIRANDIMGITRVLVTVHDPAVRTLTSPPVLRLALDVEADSDGQTVEDYVRDVLVAIAEHL